MPAVRGGDESRRSHAQQDMRQVLRHKRERGNKTMTLYLEDELRDNGGFTYDPRTGELVRIGERDGYAIAIPHTEREIKPGESVIGAVERLAREGGPKVFLNQDLYIGGWHSDDRGIDVIELTEIIPFTHIDRDEAIWVGRNRNQEGILDMRTGEFIPTGGTGDEGWVEDSLLMNPEHD